jgi:hypothetical protein
MRKIDTRDFQIATRTISREINRRIALNLIREHQPISRADLARRMSVTRVVVNGELVRGRDHIAGEFGHMPLSLDGPRCMCGMAGCWEAYISNLATLSRYFGWDLSKLSPKALRLRHGHVRRAAAANPVRLEADVLKGERSHDIAGRTEVSIPFGGLQPACD